MRPPLNAGENRHADAQSRPPPRRFNEAPAERGGKLADDLDAPAGRTRFNEAPAERGGKLLAPVRPAEQTDVASMRPPLNAGENVIGEMSLTGLSSLQ